MVTSTTDDSFSVDEVPNPMGTLEAPMQHQVGDHHGNPVTYEDATGLDAKDLSPSEWTFERLLEEELMKSTTPADSGGAGGSVSHTEPVPAAAEVEAPALVTGATPDPIEYNSMLKLKLDEDLAAFALWKTSSTVDPERSQWWSAYNGGSKNLDQSKLGDITGHHDRNASKLPASSTSMEPLQTDDDDVDGEVEIRTMPDPQKARKRKRKESNRESARRSRSRKAAHVKDLEDQVAHLRVENSLLVKRIDALNQKYKASAVDNRVMKANMETLITKVRMADGTVNRFIGTSSPSFSSIPFVGAPYYAAPPDAAMVNNSYITNSYHAAAPTAMVNNSYVPAAPSPLQAMGVINGSSNHTMDEYHAAAPNAAMVNNSYVPAAPSPLQAMGVVNGSSNHSMDEYHAAAPIAAMVNNSYIPAAPSPLQAMGVVNGSSNHTMDEYHAELQHHQNTTSAMPSSSYGGGVAPWESSAPLDIDEITDVVIEGYEDLSWEDGLLGGN